MIPLSTFIEDTALRARVEELDLGEASFYDLAEHFCERPDFVLLDSRSHERGLGRFSILSFGPFTRIVSKGSQTSISEDGRVAWSDESVFTVLQAILDRNQTFQSFGYPNLPFLGGGIGYLAYELGRQLERLPATTVDELGTPDCYMCFYNFAIILSHELRKVFLVHFQPRNVANAMSWERLKDEIYSAPAGAYEEWQPKYSTNDELRIVTDFTVETYSHAVRRILDYIFAGDAYQVNMTQRFQVDLKGTRPWQVFRHLMDLNPAPFAAYLNFENQTVVSSSPERFLLVRDRYVETRPIKGTVKRHVSPAEDAASRQWLLQSEKNRAELAMIVDLQRNDLGRCCKPGSVRVRAFPELESYASVHHLVATVTGELAPGQSVVDLLKTTFPGGSITGAPKIRAMEIIDELEPVARGVYTGSIGYLGFNGVSDLNIAIRTIVIQDGTAYIHAGGGIVADSDEQSEYEETLVKAGKLIEAVKRACGEARSGGAIRNLEMEQLLWMTKKRFAPSSKKSMT